MLILPLEWPKATKDDDAIISISDQDTRIIQIMPIKTLVAAPEAADLFPKHIFRNSMESPRLFHLTKIEDF